LILGEKLPLYSPRIPVKKRSTNRIQEPRLPVGLQIPSTFKTWDSENRKVIRPDGAGISSGGIQGLLKGRV
jgi:hypothetical protein